MTPAVTQTAMWQESTEWDVRRQPRKTSACLPDNIEILTLKYLNRSRPVLSPCLPLSSSEISNRLNDEHHKYIYDIWIFQTWLPDSSQAGHDYGAVHFAWWHWKFKFWVRWLDRQWYNKCPPISEEYQWSAGNVCVGEDHYAHGMQQ